MIKALKKCRFTGKNYSAGEIVPDSAVDKKAIGSLVRMKIIALEDDPPPVETLETPKPKRNAK